MSDRISRGSQWSHFPNATSDLAAAPFLDVNGDGVISRLDVEEVVSGLRQPGTPWQNSPNRFDVNNDGYVAPGDLLTLINRGDNREGEIKGVRNQ